MTSVVHRQRRLPPIATILSESNEIGRDLTFKQMLHLVAKSGQVPGRLFVAVERHKDVKIPGPLLRCGAAFAFQCPIGNRLLLSRAIASYCSPNRQQVESFYAPPQSIHAANQFIASDATRLSDVDFPGQRVRYIIGAIIIRRVDVMVPILQL